MKNFFDVSRDELDFWVQSQQQPAFRQQQIWDGAYKHLAESPGQVTNLPQRVRHVLESDFSFNPLTLVDSYTSRDEQTSKYLFELQDKHKVETVLMEYDSRKSICISTQSGCPVNCVFCATGQMGFHRDLTAGEIIYQVIFIERLLRKRSTSLTNVVIMGMGEPLLNYEETMKSVRTLNRPDTLNIGARRFTLSTVGIIPGIMKLIIDPIQINLAISLHASDDQTRVKLIPIAKSYPLKQLLQACRDYVENTHRRVTFEWALIEGVNDSIAMAKQFSRLVRGLLCHVNLISLNPTSFYPGVPSSPRQLQHFKSVLTDSGIPCTIRLKKGMDISAGCGQLAYANSNSS